MPVSNTQEIFNSLFGLFTFLAVIVGVIFFAVMAYFLIKYRERASSADPGDTPRLDRVPPHRGHLRSVAIVLILSSVILGFLIAGTFTQVDVLLNVPAECKPTPGDCLYVNVTGHQFYWQFTYAQNSTITYRDVLRIPVNRTIVLNVTSADVFHDFGIIDFKIKTDAIPGRTNTIWLKPYLPGNYTIQCYELCGAGHSRMKATLVVMQQSIFQEWYDGSGTR